MTKTNNRSKTADKLAMVGRKSGIELNETQLNKVAGGMLALTRPTELKL